MPATARRILVATAATLLALATFVTPASADHELCFDANLELVPCEHAPTTTAAPTTTTTTTAAPTTTTTTTAAPTTTTTTAAPPTTTAAPTTTRPRPQPTTTTTTAAPTTTTTEPAVVTVPVDANSTTTAATTLATTTTAAAPTTSAAPPAGTNTSEAPSTTTTVADTTLPELSDSDADEEATGVPTTPIPPRVGRNSTQIVWVILIALNVIMIAAVVIRRRLRRLSMLGSFEGI